MYGTYNNYILYSDIAMNSDVMDVTNDTCPFLELFSVINRKWSMLVLASIRTSGKVGYKGIENGLKGISPKALTDTLSLLMSNGLISKKKLGGIPPRVEYSLTPLGIELVELFEPIIIWAQGATNHTECPILEFLATKS